MQEVAATEQPPGSSTSAVVNGRMSNDGRSVPAVLRAIVAAHADAEIVQWLQSTSDALRAAPDRPRLRIAFARAGRKLGDRRVELTPREVACSSEAKLDGVGDAWTLRDFGRAALLLDALSSLEPNEQIECVEHMFRTGDLGEQASLVRMLALLPRPDDFAPMAAEATRTNADSVFAALACDNPYPARSLPDLNFNQMVMKAIFTGIGVARIQGLEHRVTGELVRMAGDYARERRAAGRTVPDDVATLERLLKEKP